MLIEQIRIEHVAMPLLAPWRTAYGEDTVIESVLVRMQSGTAVGWGEACPLAAPCYSPEWAASVFACVRDWLAPRLIGQDIASGEQLQQRLALVKGNPFAKAALDTAWWVLEAERQQRPLHHLLGATRSRIPVGADFGVLDTIDELLPQIATALEQGYPRIKLKFRPGWDLPMLAAVRREFPRATIHIDCNAGYRLEDLDLFQRVDEFELAMIEQPLQSDDLIDHARLQEAITTPVCLDESISSFDRARQAISLGSCRSVNIKPGRVGGLTVAVAIHNLCRQGGVACWVGGMLESAVGARICGALGMLDNFTYPADIFPSSRFYATDLAVPPLELVASPGGPQVVCSDEQPGIGAAPDAERLSGSRIARADLQA
jgi:o-succinylbenzoate synthase